MRKLRYILIPLAFLATTAYAEVSQFNFTTEVQTIKPNTDSGAITVQSQDSSGASEPIAETFDLVFTSTSGTGAFLSTSGNPISATMSKNTSNKNFIYRDSAEGSFTITVKATGRTSGKSFTITQPITVSSGAVYSTSTPTSTNENQNSSNSANTQPVVIYVYSAHSSPAPLSETENKISFEVSGGRDRLTSVGNEVLFKATVTKSQNISTQAISYKWSFGDGSISTGNTVNHSYKFPGDYVVVLNANGSDNEAVSRVNVKVVEPQFQISKVENGVMVLNNSKYEINLEGWSFGDKQNIFIFPKDTIIPAGKAITFPDDVTGLKGDVALYNPLGKSVGSFPIKDAGYEVGLSTTTISDADLKNIQAKINDVKSEVSRISLKINKSSAPGSIAKTMEKAESATTSINKFENTATVIYSAQSNSSALGKMFSIPSYTWKLIKGVFDN